MDSIFQSQANVVELYFGFSSDGKEGGSDGKEGSKDASSDNFVGFIDQAQLNETKEYIL